MSASQDQSAPQSTAAEPEVAATNSGGLSASWRAAALEAALVVLGVVLAFAVNEWRKAQVEAERSQQALEAVASEVAANRTAVAASLTYHSAKMGGLRDRQKSGESVTAAFFEQGFVHPAQVLSYAWDAAIATDAIRGWPFEKLLTVSRLYANQERYHVQSLAISEAIYGQLLAEGTEGVAARGSQLASLIASFWWRECELLAEYDLVLPVLGREAGELPASCRPSQPPRRGDPNDTAE